jgi:hypothetical protein
VYEKYLLVNRGFRNVSQNGKSTGFQVKIRIPYYRGVCLSMIKDVTIIVDGEKFPLEKLKMTFGDHSYSFDEMKNVNDVYWRFGEMATLTVEKQSGLKMGMHTVEVRILVDTGGGNTPYSQAGRRELVERLATDREKYLEERYKYSLSGVSIGKVTRTMTLVQ